MAIILLEGVGQLKIAVTLGIELITYGLLAYFLDQVLHRVPSIYLPLS
jgi:hypothetical protein